VKWHRKNKKGAHWERLEDVDSRALLRQEITAKETIPQGNTS